MATEQYDAVIVGGGLVGLAAAVAVAGQTTRIPLNVCIIDPASPQQFHGPRRDGRASAITASSMKMLEAMGLWADLEEHAQPMRDIIVTDTRPGASERPALLHFGEQHAPGTVSAYMIENTYLYQALLGAVTGSLHVDVRPGHTVEKFEFAGPGARVTLAGSHTLACRLVIGADGRNSAARAAAGIDTVGWDYDQSGVTLTVEHERDHEGWAEEHFLPAGPFAILPLPGKRSSLVWTETRQFADELLAMDYAAFQAELESRFGSKLGAVRPVGERFAYPLSLQISKSFVAPRLALIGDAAHVIHPIAGLGFNLGLRDVAALAQVLSETVRRGLDPGAIDTLERYQAWRRLDTVMVAVATDGINRLFSNDNSSIRAIRDLGLGVVNQAGFMKSAFMREAAGLGGELPKLLAGEPL